MKIKILTPVIAMLPTLLFSFKSSEKNGYEHAVKNSDVVKFNLPSKINQGSSVSIMPGSSLKVAEGNVVSVTGSISTRNMELSLKDFIIENEKIK